MYLVLSLSHSSSSSFRGSSWTMWYVCNGEIWEKVVVVIGEITTLEFHCSSIVGLITIGVVFLCHSFLDYIKAVSMLLSVWHTKWMVLFNFVYRLKSIGNNRPNASKLPDGGNNSWIPLLYSVEWLIAAGREVRILYGGSRLAASFFNKILLVISSSIPRWACPACIHRCSAPTPCCSSCRW